MNKYRIALIGLLVIIVALNVFSYKKTFYIDSMTGDNKVEYSSMGIALKSRVIENRLIISRSLERKWEIVTEKNIWSKKEYYHSGKLNAYWSELMVLKKLLGEKFSENLKEKSVEYLQNRDHSALKRTVEELRKLNVQ